MRSLPTISVLAALTLWLAASVVSPAPAADWPHWRGPDREAVSSETGLLTEWPAAGPRRLWTAEGLGNGYSSVTIVGGKIYTMGGSRRTGQAVIALDESTGRKVWAAKVSRTGQKTQSTPTTSEGLVYALATDSELPRQGGPAWAHPVVCNGKLYLRWADKLFCFDVKGR